MSRYIAFMVFLQLLFGGCKTSLSQTFEAENATLSGGAQKQALASASGGYYVAMGEGNLSMNISLPDDGIYTIYMYVAAPFGNKTNTFRIGDVSVDFTLASNSSYIKLAVANDLKLSAGNHTLQVIKSWGWINIDYFQFEKITAGSKVSINDSLVTPNSIPEAKNLYQFLYDNYGKKIISGVMTLGSMDEVNWLKTNTGKQPALVGLDFMHCNRGYTWYNNEEPINDAKAYYNKNGIPALCWHWRDPLRKTEEFYTDKTTFNVSKIFDTTSIEYIAMIKDIDYIAGLLKKLQNQGVPVIWRPLHEAAGGWFWWGAKGAAPCKKLYQVMYHRMVDYHGLRNLIWVWTREPGDDAWYPGDEYVDIVGRDIYKTGDHSSHIAEFNQMNLLYGKKKMLTISECGSFPDPDNLVKYGAAWSYFMPWYGDFVRSSTHNSLALWKKALEHEYVLTLDEMPVLRTYSTPTSAQQIVLMEQHAIRQISKKQVLIESNQAIGIVVIYSSQGKAIRYLSTSDRRFVYEFADLPPGIYVLKTETSTFKFVQN